MAMSASFMSKSGLIGEVGSVKVGQVKVGNAGHVKTGHCQPAGVVSFVVWQPPMFPVQPPELPLEPDELEVAETVP